jgi:hypothetical protein
MTHDSDEQRMERLVDKVAKAFMLENPKTYAAMKRGEWTLEEERTALAEIFTKLPAEDRMHCLEEALRSLLSALAFLDVAGGIAMGGVGLREDGAMRMSLRDTAGKTLEIVLPATPALRRIIVDTQGARIGGTIRRALGAGKVTQ